MKKIFIVAALSLLSYSIASAGSRWYSIECADNVLVRNYGGYDETVRIYIYEYDDNYDFVEKKSFLFNEIKENHKKKFVPNERTTMIVVRLSKGYEGSSLVQNLFSDIMYLDKGFSYTIDKYTVFNKHNPAKGGN